MLLVLACACTPAQRRKVGGAMILVGGAATAASIYVLAKGTSTGGTGVTDTTSSPHYPLGFSLLGGGLGLVIGGIVMYLLQER